MKKMNFFRHCMMMAVALFAGAAMVACGGDDEETPVGPGPDEYKTPTVTLTAGEITATTLAFTVETTEATELAYSYIQKGNMAPTPADILVKGTKLEVQASQSVLIEALKAETTYQIYAAVTNPGGMQVISKVLEMTTAEDKKEPGTQKPNDGDNYIKYGNNEAEKILYAIYDANGGANYTFNFTTSNLAERFLDLTDVEKCSFYVSISPTPPSSEIGVEEVSVANGNYGYIRVRENIGTGGSYRSWYCMPGDPGASGTVKVTLLDAETEEYEVSLDATLPPFMGATEPMKVKLYYKGIIKNEATEGDPNDNPDNPGGPTGDLVPLPEGNAFTVGDKTIEVKSAVYEADPDNDMMIKTYLCAVEGITKIADAEKVEHMLCYLDSTSIEQGAPMVLPSNLGVYFEYRDAEGNVVAQWLPTDVDYSGECNAGMYPASDVAMSVNITCQTTLDGGLAIKYSGLATWDNRYFEGSGGTEVIQ